MSTIPSKEEIRKKYDLEEADFQVLTANSPPSPSQLKREGSSLEKVGYWGNFEVWFMRSLIGRTVRAVLLISAIVGFVEQLFEYSPIVCNNAAKVYYFLESVGDTESEPDTYYVYLPPSFTPDDNRYYSEHPNHTPNLSTGTGIYPLSSGEYPQFLS